YAGQLPITDIKVSAAKAYAHWLSSESGHAYSLPTDVEWLHAARAGVGWKQSPDSNCLPPSSDGNNGDGSPISALGRQPNPWGLVNMTGNVWEWVLLPNGGLGVRGGSYNSYWSDCTVNAFRSDSGAPQRDVGFRIFRALK
ncbi:Sulphatase-modifying factor domain protein, partial [mine drainage metagenome]